MSIFFFILFGFKGNVLYWVGYNVDKQGNPTVSQSSKNWLKLQLDHKNPPTVNNDKIKSIFVSRNPMEISIYVEGGKKWVLYYTDDEGMTDWYCKRMR